MILSKNVTSEEFACPDCPHGTALTYLWEWKLA